MPVIEQEPIVRIQIKMAGDFKKKHPTRLVEVKDEGDVDEVALKIIDYFSPDFTLNASDEETKSCFTGGEIKDVAHINPDSTTDMRSHTLSDYQRVFNEILKHKDEEEKLFWHNKLNE